MRATWRETSSVRRYLPVKVATLFVIALVGVPFLLLKGCEAAYNGKDDSPFAGDGLPTEVVNGTSVELVLHRGDRELFRLGPGQSAQVTRGDGECLFVALTIRTTDDEEVLRREPPICGELIRVGPEDLP